MEHSKRTIFVFVALCKLLIIGLNFFFFEKNVIVVFVIVCGGV